MSFGSFYGHSGLAIILLIKRVIKPVFYCLNSKLKIKKFTSIQENIIILANKRAQNEKIALNS